MPDSIKKSVSHAITDSLTSSFPLVVAHRGGKGPYSENTLEAFLRSAQNGCHALEMDIRFDAPHKRFFLEHDFFHHPKKRLNTLDKVVPHLPIGTALFVEIKTLSWFSKRLARSFAAAYKEFFTPYHTTVISFNPFVLWQLRGIIPGIRLGFLCGNPFWDTLFKKIFYPFIKPEFYLLHKKILSAKNVSYGKNKGMQVFSFVLNKQKHWQRALQLGIDGIITDYPEKLNLYER